MNEMQLSLFGERIPQTVRPEPVKGATIQERFEAFHLANPAVYRVLRSICLSTRRSGVRHWSIKAAFEIARWQYALQTQGEEYRLSNDYHSRYARLLMECEPELADFFETRDLRAK